MLTLPKRVAAVRWNKTGGRWGVSVLGRMFMAAVWAVVLPGALMVCFWAVRVTRKRLSKKYKKKIKCKG